MHIVRKRKDSILMIGNGAISGAMPQAIKQTTFVVRFNECGSYGESEGRFLDS